MPVNMSQNSLNNLVPGRLPASVDYAGRDLVVAAIAEKLAPDFLDDDVIRFHLGKVWDFEVTEAVRAAVVQRKALQVYNAFVSIVSGELVDGRDVSLNGFATFESIRPPDGWEVGIERGSYAFRVILPSDARVSERRAAAVLPGWDGVLASEYAPAGATYAAGTVTEYNASTATYTVINGSVVKKTGADLGLNVGVRVTAVGTDGVSRTYAVGGVNLVVWCERQLRPIENSDDLQLYLLPVANQEARAAAERVGLSAEYIAENVGRDLPMVASEWPVVAARTLDDVSEGDLSWEFFVGVLPDVAAQAFPRSRQIIRASGRVFEVRRVPPAEFKAHFGYQEDYLRSIGAWPEPTRGGGPRVRTIFRQEVIDAVQ